MNPFSVRIFILLILSALILGGVSYQVTGNINQLIAQNSTIDRSQSLLVTLHMVASKTREMQVRKASFAETGTSLKVLVSQIESGLAALDNATAADPEQHSRVVRFAELVHGRISSSRAGENPKENDLLNSAIGQIDAAERSRLALVQQALNNGAVTTLTVVAGGAATCCAIFLFLFWLIDREGARRGKSEASLRAIVEEMERIQQDMQQMAHLADYLQSCRQVGEVYSLVKQHLVQLFPQFSGALGVHNPTRNVVETVALWGPGPVTEPEEFLSEDCWALRRGMVHAVKQGSSEPYCNHLIYKQGEAICFPMVAHGETIGVLSVSAAEGRIDARSEQLLRSASEHISMAIANIQLEQTLRLQSMRDPLTQLYNRRYMEASLEREIFRAKRKGEPISIIMVDMDHFKRLNDQYGHEAGDYVLQEFAKLLKRSVREEDIACRYGGEEFLLIMPGAALPVAEARAEKLRATMENTELNFRNIPLGRVTLSLGVLTYPLHSDDPTELVSKADEALYRAKHQGRNRVEIAQAAPDILKSA